MQKTQEKQAKQKTTEDAGHTKSSPFWKRLEIGMEGSEGFLGAKNFMAKYQITAILMIPDNDWPNPACCCCRPALAGAGIAGGASPAGCDIEALDRIETERREKQGLKIRIQSKALKTILLKKRRAFLCLY